MIARCACGSVEIEMTGAPILTAACYCDDCQAGAREIEALPNARPFRDPHGGTPMSLYRKDRVRVIRGASFLHARKLRPKTLTNRVVATCCNSAMFVSFDRGPHWTSVFSTAFDGDAPPLEMRVNTGFAPGPVPDDVPSYSGAPFGFVWKLVRARIEMLLG
jgi:hypothetical protein